MNCSRNNIFRSSLIDFKCVAFIPKNSICIWIQRQKGCARWEKEKAGNLEEIVRVPNSNLAGWLGMKIELPEIRQGLDFASSGERGFDLTETWILSILTAYFPALSSSVNVQLGEILKNINLFKLSCKITLRHTTITELKYPII